jgi:glycosyltransferase involved in cell wall biosynthesis
MRYVYTKNHIIFKEQIFYCEAKLNIDEKKSFKKFCDSSTMRVETPKPIISVLISSFKRKEFILDCLNSLFHQTLERNKFEIVVVKNYVDQKIDSFMKREGIVVVHSTSERFGSQIIEGIESSQGDLIAFLDDDDRFHEDKLKRIIEIFSLRRDLSYLHNEQLIIDVNGKKLLNLGRRIRKTEERIVNNEQREDLVVKSILRTPRIFHNNSSVTIRRDMLYGKKEYLEKIETSLDLFLFFCAIQSKKELDFIPDKLTEYRLHNSESNSTIISKTTASKLIALLERQMVTLKVIKNMSSGSFFLIYVDQQVLLTEMRLSVLNGSYRGFYLKNLNLRHLFTYRFYPFSEVISWLFFYLVGKMAPSLSRSWYLKFRTLTTIY